MLPLLVACGSQSSQDEMASGLQDIVSWAATAHMTGDAWSQGSVPTAFARQTLGQTSEQLQSDIQGLSSLAQAQTPTPEGTPLKQHLQRLQDVVGQMTAAVEKGDHAAMAQQVKRLATEEQAIKEFQKSVGAGR